MPVTKVETPDGSVLNIEHPDGAVESDILQFAQREYYRSLFSGPQQALPVQEEGPSGFFDGLTEFGQRALGSAAQTLYQAPGGVEGLFSGEDFDVDDEIAERHRSAQEGIREFFGYDEEYDDGTLDLLASASGSLLAFAAPALAAGLAPVSLPVAGAIGLVGAGALGIGNNVAGYITEGAKARDQGIAPTDYATGKYKAGAIGATEALPIMRLFRPIKKSILKDPVALDSLTKRIQNSRLASIGVSGGTEAIQEVTAGLLNDLNIRKHIDPNAAIGDSMLDDAMGGAFAGALMETILGFVPGARRTQNIRDYAIEEEQRLRDEIEETRLDSRIELDAGEEARDDIPSSAVDDQPLAPDALEVASQAALAGGPEAVALQYRQTAKQIRELMGDDFPVDDTFRITEVSQATEDAPAQIAIIDSQGRLYGTSAPVVDDVVVSETGVNRASNNRVQLTALASALNNEAIQERIYQNNRLILDESPETYDAEQTKTLQEMGRRVLGPEASSYTAAAANYAGGTTLERGYKEDLTAQEAIDQNIPNKERTVAQKINAKRIEKGLPETSRFTISEIRSVIGKDVSRLTEFVSGVNQTESLRPIDLDGSPAVAVEQGGQQIAVIKNRKLTAQEKEAIRAQGRKPPSRIKFASPADAQQYADYVNATKGQSLLPAQDIFGDFEVGRDKFAQLLTAKNIDADVNSPEVRQLAKLFTGAKLRRDQTIMDLSPAELQFFYHRLRSLPRFNTPTKIPLFEIKPYNRKRLKAAIDHRQTTGKDISKEEFDAQFGSTTTQAYNKIIRTARQQAQKQVLELPSPSVAAGVNPVTRKEVEAVIKQRLAKLNLTDIDGVATDLVRDVERDADGNVVLGGVVSRTASGLYKTSGQRVIQLSVDRIMAESTDPKDFDRIVAEVLNHEIVHALRELDVITESELNLLERLTRRYKKAGTEKTYRDWAMSQYADFDNPVKIIEEAVAEMVSDSIMGKVVISNKPTKMTGKPQSVVKKITGFFKEMVGLTQEADAASFTEFLTALESGEIGARERGKIRTLYRLERKTKQFLDRPDPFADVVPTVAEIDEDDSPEATASAAKAMAGADGLVDIDQAEEAAKQTDSKDSETERLRKIAGLDDVMFSRRIERAVQQDFDVDTIMYHGAKVGDIKKFGGRTGMGVVAAHTTKNPRFATQFTGIDPQGKPFESAPVGAGALQDALIEDKRPTVYPLFLRNFLPDNTPPEQRMVEGRLQLKKSLFDVREAARTYKNNEVAVSQRYTPIDTIDAIMNSKLDSRPELLADLTRYFSKELDAFLKSRPMSRIKNYDAQMLAMEYQIRGEEFRVNREAEKALGLDKKMAPELPHIISNLSLDAGRTLIPELFIDPSFEAVSALAPRSNPIDPYDDDAPSRMARRYERMMQNVNPDVVLSKESIVRAIVELFHQEDAPRAFRQFKIDDELGIDFIELEVVAPYIKDAGFAGYRDIEVAFQPYTAVAIFDPSDIKGAFADFNPDAVPEGMKYDDDFMFSRRMADSEASYARRLEGMPESFEVDGQSIEFGYHEPALEAAVRYTIRADLPYEPLKEYAPVDEDVARRIAVEYDLMEDAPDDPTVKAAYEAMAEETKEQYKAILDTGLEVQFIKGKDPYGNPRNAILDVVNNNHMFVFSTKDGYGSEESLTADLSRNPMLQETEFRTADGDPMLLNDVFRVVHDYFGHIKNGVGFRARGEENAWQSHAAMYSPLARRAMTSETRGQNSWVNFGPYAEQNKNASGADTIYADQKIGLLPLWVSEEARQSDPRRTRDRGLFQQGLEGAIRPDQKLSLTHFGHSRFARTDPKMAGRGLDRTRRYSPEGTFFGITEATTNGYRKEAGLGNIRHDFAVDSHLMYPMDTDPYGLLQRNPAGNLDWDNTLAALNNAGFIGLWTDRHPHGKVAFINQPLISEQETKAGMPTLGKTKAEIISSPEARADKAVEQQTLKAEERVAEYAKEKDLDPIETVTLDDGPFAFARREGMTTSNEGTPSFIQPSGFFGKSLIYRAQDKLVTLKQIERAINDSREKSGLPPLTIDRSAYRGEETIPGKLGNFARLFDEREKKPLIDAMVKAGVSVEQMDRFLILRHAIERNARIRKINPRFPDAGAGELNGMKLTDQYVNDLMQKEFGMSWNSAKGEWQGQNEKGRIYNKLAKRVDDINATTLMIQEQGGLLTSEGREQLANFYKYYVPLRGVFRDEEMAMDINEKTAGSGGTLSITGAGKEYISPKGRGSQAFSPLAVMFTERGVKTARSVKNVSFGKRLVNLIQDFPNDEVWELYTPDSKQYKEAFESTYTYVGSDPNIPYGTKKRDVANEPDRKNWVKRVKMVESAPNAQAEELLGVVVDGEQYYVHFKDENLRRAAVNLDAQTTNRWVNALNRFTRYLSMVNTSLNPDFFIPNFFRDLETAIPNLAGEQTMRDGLAPKEVKGFKRKVVTDTFRGSKSGGLGAIGIFYKGFRNPEKLHPDDLRDFNEYIKTGAKTDWFHSSTPEEQIRNLQNMEAVARGTLKGMSLQAKDAFMGFVNDTNAAVENGVRLSAFKNARDAFIEKGMERDLAIQQAASLAKNLTVNFNRKGQNGNFLNALYLFFNAAIQSSAALVRGLNVLDPNSSRLKQGIVASLIGSGALMSYLIDQLLDMDEMSEKELRDLEEHIRERNFIVPDALLGLVGMDYNPEGYSKIPMPYGYSAFYIMGDVMYQVAAGKESVAAGGVRLANAILGSFSPIGSSTSETVTQTIAKTVAPTVMDPVMEQLLNSNYFGGPVYKEPSPFEDAPKVPSLRSFENTPPFYKWLSESLRLGQGTQYEPGFLEIEPDIFKHYVQFLGGGAGGFFDRAVFRTGASLMDPSYDLEVKDIPFLRKIRGEFSDRVGSERFYDRRDILLRKEASAEDEEITFAERSAYRKENMPFLKMLPALRQAENALTQLRKQRKILHARKRKASEQGLIQIALSEERLDEKEAAVIARFNRAYDKALGKDE